MIAVPLQAPAGFVSHSGATLLLREAAFLSLVVDFVLIATVLERRKRHAGGAARTGGQTFTLVAAARDLIASFVSPRGATAPAAKRATPGLVRQPSRPAPVPPATFSSATTGQVITGRDPAAADPAAAGSSAEPAPRREKVRLPAADGLRGLAAILVVCFHTLYAAGLPKLDGWRTFLASGYMGVDFFFVLSGFLLFLPVALANGKFGSRATYTVRRVIRILPAFYVAVFATVLLHPYITKGFQKLPFSSSAVWTNIVLHLTFLQHSIGLAAGYQEGFGVNGAVWTLSIEAVFYVLLPFVAFWYFRRPFIGLAVALAGSIVWKYEVIHGGITLSHTAGAPTVAIGKVILITQFPSYLAHFAIGMTGAWIFVKFRKSRLWQVPAAGVALQIIGLAGVIWGMIFYGNRDLTKVAGILDHWVWTTPVAFAFGILLLGTLLAPKLARTPFANPVVRWLGQISYGIYLFHLLFLYYALETLHFSQNGTPTAFFHLIEFTLGGAIVAGALSYYLIERPLVGWARRLSDRRAARHVRAPAPAPVPTPRRTGGLAPRPVPRSAPVPAPVLAAPALARPALATPALSRPALATSTLSRPALSSLGLSSLGLSGATPIAAPALPLHVPATVPVPIPLPSLLRPAPVAPPVAPAATASRLGWASRFGTLGRPVAATNGSANGSSHQPAPAVPVPVHVAAPVPVQPLGNLASPFSFRATGASTGHPNGNGNGRANGNGYANGNGIGNGQANGNGIGHGHVNGNTNGHVNGNGNGHGTRYRAAGQAAVRQAIAHTSGNGKGHGHPPSADYSLVGTNGTAATGHPSHNGEDPGPSLERRRVGAPAGRRPAKVPAGSGTGR